MKKASQDYIYGMTLFMNFEKKMTIYCIHMIKLHIYVCISIINTEIQDTDYLLIMGETGNGMEDEHKASVR